eukprot:TRINITY_DN778_c0_g1_i1.p1 TRINITY_DN778_c0_g1~~TRINITY_DN778_c0_g1_i1.p1  ORF type:complete len:296 (-),score=26.60 TRINITY_DN778_c0_g1_i1:81-968(-)
MGDGCCGETGAFGIVLIIIACLVNGAIGIGCITVGILHFIWKKDYGQAMRFIYLIGLIISGVIILMLMIIAAIAFSISDTGRNAAIAAFTITFFFELVIFIILFIAFFKAWRMGDKFNLNLVAVFGVPVGMAFCVIAVLLLLIERTSLGATALTIIAIVMIVLTFICLVLLVVGTVFLIIHNVRGAQRMFIWVVSILLIICSILYFIGFVLTCFFARSLTVGAVGFILCCIITGILLAVFLFYWFFSARKDHDSAAQKWAILALGCGAAFFFAVGLIGLLCMGGLWITSEDPTLG